MGNLAQLHVVRGIGPADLGAKFVESLLQCGTLFRLDQGLGDSRSREASGRAQQDSPDAGQWQKQSKSRAGCSWSDVRPPCGPGLT